jgi:hypothetical protein
MQVTSPRTDQSSGRAIHTNQQLACGMTDGGGVEIHRGQSCYSDWPVGRTIRGGFSQGVT